MTESVSDVTRLRSETWNCLLTVQGELLRWYTYVCVHECMWIHTLEVITPVNVIPQQETLTRIGSFGDLIMWGAYHLPIRNGADRSQMNLPLSIC